MTGSYGVVVFADVVGSRSAGPASSSWLRSLCAELDEAYGAARIAPFGFTQGDELQGLLHPDADPLAAVLRGTLRASPRPSMRWVIAAGRIEEGEGPATQRTGPAFLLARDLSSSVRRRRDSLVVRSGDAASDELLDDVAPPLGVLLDGLTETQRVVARLLLVDGLRQVDAAAQLGVARPTVSVAAERAHVREIERLAHATLTLLRTGLASVADAGAATDLAITEPSTSAPSVATATDVEGAHR